jgi:hypothetical protein
VTGGASPAPGTFVEQTLTYTTGASPAQLGKTLRIDVIAPTTASGEQADFDLFALDATPVGSAVPEPSTSLLLILGLGLMTGMPSLRRLRSR